MFSNPTQGSDTRINPDLLANPWKAKWIAHPTASGREYGVFLFRQTFELEAQPDSFIIHVSADNRYRLFVNSKPVGFGPARGDLMHWYFETFNIASKLKSGKNTLAAMVWNFGEQMPLAQISHRTAFILQGNSTKEAIVNTNDNWKVTHNQAYQPIPVSFSMVKGYYAASPGDHFTAALHPWGWEQEAFDDNEWMPAKPISVGKPRGFRWGGPWFLVPRTIPMMEEKLERFPAPKHNSHLTNWLPNVVIPADSQVTLFLDQTYLTVGYPELKVSGGTDAKIKLTYAEALFDEKGMKGNRNDLEGKSIFGYYDVFLPDGGDNRLFRPLWLRTYRFIQMDIETQDEPLTIHDFYGIFTAYPFIEQARFNSDNKLLHSIWEVGWRTARLCAGEIYFDCPYYEQLQYIGDTRIQALISLYVAGDDQLMRQAITQLDYSRIPEGLTQSRYPSYLPQIIPPFSLLWVAMVHDYFMYRNDPAFVKQFLPGIRSVLNWFERHLDETGMLGKMSWWNYVDKVPAYSIGVPPGANDGNSALITLQYLYALQYAIALHEAFGLQRWADEWKQQAASVKKAVYKHCFSEAKGLLADTPKKQSFSQHTSVMAILTNTIEISEQKAIMEKILTDDSLIQSNIYYQFYLFRALKKVGLGNRYLEHLESWKTMLANGMTTFGEFEKNPRSDCHAWSASPLFDLLNTVCGIESAAPGFKRVRIAPHLGTLKQVVAVMPHIFGNIEVELIKNQTDGIEGKIILPNGLEGEFI